MSVRQLTEVVRPAFENVVVPRNGLRRAWVARKALDTDQNTWNWTPSELIRRIQGRPDVARSVANLTLLPKPQGANFVSQWLSKKVEWKVKDALRKFEIGRIPMQCRLDPAMFWMEHEHLPQLAQNDRFQVIYENSYVWLTSAGLRTSLHSDEDDGLLFHLFGEKRAILVPPESSDRSREFISQLMQLRKTSGSINDLYLTESVDHSPVSNVERHIVDLKPGDILHIPKRWLHDIESITPTVSIAVRFSV